MRRTRASVKQIETPLPYTHNLEVEDFKMRLAWFALSLGCLHAQTTLVIRPEVVTRCNTDGLGTARIIWEGPGPGPVQVRVDSPDGPAMTGPEAPAGSAETGSWVRDGMVFVLVDAAGRELARDTAHVRCAFQEVALADALAAGDYLPLQVGNQWVYRVNTRQATSGYLVWRVARAESIEGKTWYVVAQSAAGEVRYRADVRGRIYRMPANGPEELWLDPTTPPDRTARLTVERRGVPFTNALGSFRDSLVYSTPPGLTLERGTFVRGLGLAASRTDMLSGSSGGFLESLELVYARLGDNLVFGAPAAGLELTAESTDLDVTGRNVTNCTVPCYFVACGLVPGADPPGTYKPCFQARLRIEGAGAGAEVSLVDSSGAVVFSATSPLDPGAVLFRQIPLYSAPNQPLPPGAYRLRARLLAGDGAETAEASLVITLR